MDLFIGLLLLLLSGVSGVLLLKFIVFDNINNSQGPKV